MRFITKYVSPAVLSSISVGPAEFVAVVCFLCRQVELLPSELLYACCA
jgi:hypothetical protein